MEPNEGYSRKKKKTVCTRHCRVKAGLQFESKHVEGGRRQNGSPFPDIHAYHTLSPNFHN